MRSGGRCIGWALPGIMHSSATWPKTFSHQIAATFLPPPQTPPQKKRSGVRLLVNPAAQGSGIAEDVGAHVAARQHLSVGQQGGKNTAATACGTLWWHESDPLSKPNSRSYIPQRSRSPETPETPTPAALCSRKQPYTPILNYSSHQEPTLKP